MKLTSVPILKQLQWEEALLRADKHNWCILNHGSPLAIVLGISGQAHQLIEQKKIKEAPIPIIRRFSGGGTVVIDPDTLFVSLICQTDALPLSPFPRILMRWTAEKLYQPLFPFPLFQLQENDYTLGARKWGGNAQSIIQGRWLHHSSLLWDYQADHMDYLLVPPKAPAYRQERSHNEFLCRLKEYWPHLHSFQERIIQQLSEHFLYSEKTQKEIEEIAKQPHRKVTCLI